jgi:hypothetical protein
MYLYNKYSYMYIIYPTMTSARSCNKVKHETNDVILYIHSVHKHWWNTFQRQNYKMRLKQRSLNWINSMQVKKHLLKFFRQINYTEKAKILYFLNLVYFLSLVDLWQNHVFNWTLIDFMWRHTTPFGKWRVIKYVSVCNYYRSFFHGTLQMWARIDEEHN